MRVFTQETSGTGAEGLSGETGLLLFLVVYWRHPCTDLAIAWLHPHRLAVPGRSCVVDPASPGTCLPRPHFGFLITNERCRGGREQGQVWARGSLRNRPLSWLEAASSSCSPSVLRGLHRCARFPCRILKHLPTSQRTLDTRPARNRKLRHSPSTSYW